MKNALLFSVAIGSFFSAAILAQVEVHSSRPSDKPSQSSSAIQSGAPHSPIIEISSKPSVTRVSRLGVNIGQWAYYEAAAGEFQNIVQNPGFEKSEAGRVVVAPSSGLTASEFCDQNNWWPYPSGFFNGVSFQDVYASGSGATAKAATRGTGTITGYNPTGCKSNTPQFTYHAAFEIRAGDYIFFHGTGNLNPGLKSPGYPPAGWWNNDAQWQLVADTGPKGEGKQALDLPLNGSSHSIDQYSDTCGNCYTNPSGGTQNFLLVNGSWTVSVWAKGLDASSDASVNVTFGRIGGATWVNQTFTPASVWTKYSWTFTGGETSLTSPVGPLHLTIVGNGARGDLRFNDVFVGQTSVRVPPWSDQFVSVLDTLHPGVIRAWQSDEGDSYDNMVADDASRGPTSAGASTGGNWVYSLDAFLKLASVVGAVPWINVPMELSDSELSSLGNYLAAEQSKYNFSSLMLEFADEQWNGGSCGGVCTSASGDIYIAVDGRAFGIIKAAAAGRVPLQAVAGGQYGAYPPGGNISTVAPTAKAQGMNYVGMAPYYWFCDNHKSETTLLSDFLNDQNIQLPAIQSVFTALNGLSAAGYEAGPSTVWGTMTDTERNHIIAGAASATADAELALNWWTAGGSLLATWNLLQTNFTSTSKWDVRGLCTINDSPPGGRMQAYMWGLVHDIYTPLIRPRGLAMQLLNRYFISSSTGNFHPAKVTGYQGVVVGAWEDVAHGHGWNVAAVNTMSYPQPILVRFPDLGGSRLPAAQVWQINYRRAITDENEECPDAKEGCEPDVTIGRGRPIVAGPSAHEITIWIPAYGLVVGAD